MIFLDTNVLSELGRRNPDEKVLAWLDSLPPMEVATTAVTVGELLYGVSRLPSGRRKAALAEAVHVMINDDLAGRVAPFDLAAAEHFAQVVTDREQAGRPVAVADAQIAAICRVYDADLATRNIKDFENTGVELVDPWKFAGN